MDVVDLVKEAPLQGKVSFPYFVNPLPAFKWILGEIWHKKWEVSPNGMDYSIALSWGFFSHKNCGSWHMCGKLCDIIQYNVKHLMFIVTYKLHSNEKLTLGYGKCYEPWLFVREKSDFILTNLQENVQSCMNFSSRHTWFLMELIRVFFGFHKKRFLSPWINIFFEVEFSHVLISKIWFRPIQRVFHKKLAQIC